jgi:hypothetical protein
LPRASFLRGAAVCPVLKKTPIHQLAPKHAPDPLQKASQYYELDPSKLDDRDKLLQLMAGRLFSGASGRPKGTSKLTLQWRIQLLLDAAGVRKDRKLSGRKLAGLLRQKFPKRYSSVSDGWLRQCLLIGLPRDLEAMTGIDAKQTEFLLKAARAAVAAPPVNGAGFRAEDFVRLILLGTFLIAAGRHKPCQRSSDDEALSKALTEARSFQEAEDVFQAFREGRLWEIQRSKPQ